MSGYEGHEDPQSPQYASGGENPPLNPDYFVGNHRQRAAVRSANDNEQRRALRRMFKGIAPLRFNPFVRAMERVMRLQSKED